MKHVAIAGGTDETRLLLRGLVRLHHHRVVAEGFGPEVLREIPTDGGDPVLLVDADLEEPRWADALRAWTRAHPNAQVILLTPSRSPQIEAHARALGVTGLLRRPFAVHELVEVLDPPTRSPPSSEKAAESP